MGEFVTGPMLVEDAREYDMFSDQAAKIMLALVEEGRIPDTEMVLDYIALNRRLWGACRDQADAAARQGATAFVARLPLTDGEFKLFGDMGQSLGSLMEIISMRGDIGLAPPASADRFGQAVAAGTFHP